MKLRQRIGFVTSADGTRIATAVVGSGPPLVRAAHWLSHVEYDAESPVWRPWLHALSARHSYLRYDQRGCGLSDRDARDFSLEAMVADLEAITCKLPGPFPLIGMSQGAAVSIAFAQRHPERVSRLVLVGAYARGALVRPAGDGQRQEAEALLTLVRLGWGRDNPAFRQVFTHYSLLLRRRPADLPPDATLAASMAAGVALMLALSLFFAPSLHFTPSAPVLGALAYVVVLPSLVAFLLWSWGVARIGPERAGQYVHLMPVFGPVLAMAILGEQIAPAQAAGAVVVFAGIAMVVRARRQGPRQGCPAAGAGAAPSPSR